MFKPLDKNKTGLKEYTIEKIIKVLTSFPKIKKVVLYGSRAKGNYRNGSDIDLCLIGNDLDSETILRLDDELDDLYLAYTFDLSIYDKIDNPNFKDHINRVGVVFYSNLDP